MAAGLFRKTRQSRITIRFKLGRALAFALLPVLALGLVQAVIDYHRDVEIRQTALSQGALRSASVARARIQGSIALLDTLTPQTVGAACTPKLAAILKELNGYRNILRLDAQGRVQCQAAKLSSNADPAKRSWFIALRNGAPFALARSLRAPVPALLAATRAQKPDGRFDGALIASLKLESLRPDLSDPTLPTGTAVSIVNGTGDVLIQTDPRAFSPLPANGLAQARVAKLFYTAKDRSGVVRDFAVAPLLGKDVFVVLSAPAPPLMFWGRLHIVSSLIYPLLAWLAAWAALWIVTEHVVIRWLTYLDRIAAIYAKGRFSVRPLQAEAAPAEIQVLAHTLDTMAEGITARDLSLRESIAHKDALMREIHHRVKNNLQVITSLLNMQQRALTDPAARMAMSDTRQRITALALIYRALYQSPDLRRVDVRQFLEELIGQLSTSEAGRPSKIHTRLEADALDIDPDKLAPLALFAVEAISNARKHAFDEHGGAIDVRFKVSDEEIMLEIVDNGSGDIDAAGSGVGHTLMSAFARQLRGRTEIEPVMDGGVAVRLIFPAPSAAPLIDPAASSGNQAAA